MSKATQTPQQAAEFMGIRALSYIGEDPVRLAAFLGDTGLRPDTLRAAATNPQFLGRVVEFIRSDETMAREFCKAQDLDARTLAAVHEILAGSDWERDVP